MDLQSEGFPAGAGDNSFQTVGFCDVPPAGMVLDLLNEGFPEETRPMSRKKRRKELLPVFERIRERYTGKAVAFIVCRRARFVDYPLQIFRGGIRRAPGGGLDDGCGACLPGSEGLPQTCGQARDAAVCRLPRGSGRLPLDERDSL